MYVVLSAIFINTVIPLQSSMLNFSNNIVGLSYSYSEKTLFFNTMKEEDVRIGTFTILSKSLHECEAKVVSNNTAVSLQIKSSDKTRYLLEFKRINSQSCRFTSSNYTFGSFDAGLGVQVETRFNVFPETFVNPEVFMNIGVSFEKYNFNFTSDIIGIKTPLNVEFQTLDISCGLGLAKKLTPIFSVYTIGSMVVRSSDMKDKENFYSISGIGYTVDLSLGVKIYISEREMLILSATHSAFAKNTFLGCCTYTVKL